MQHTAPHSSSHENREPNVFRSRHGRARYREYLLHLFLLLARGSTSRIFEGKREQRENAKGEVRGVSTMVAQQLRGCALVLCRSSSTSAAYRASFDLCRPYIA